MVRYDKPIGVLFNDEFDPNAFDFRRGDYDAINTDLYNADWTFLTSCSDADDVVDNFTAMIQELIFRHVPRVRPRRKPVWGNQELSRLKRRKNACLRAYHSIRSAYNCHLFKLASREYKTLNKVLYFNYVRNTERNIHGNPKHFWRFVNNKRNENGLPSTMFLNDEVASSTSSKCALFAKYFLSVFSMESIPPDNALRYVASDGFSVGTLSVVAEDVACAVSKLKQSYCPGPDGIPAALLKKCCETLKSPIATIFNISLRKNKFPESWKSSFMFPVFKKGDKHSVENYRGITSLCACSKVLEAIVYDHLLFRVKSYISTAQHGFYPGRSVSTNLLEFTSLCLRTMEQGNQIDTIYTDLKAAFDRVDHGILLAKLNKLGASSSLLSWLSTYLRGRKISVRVGSSQSRWFQNGSGVPQGSILGPLLFSLFVNDITRLLPHGTRLCYADDVKIYLPIETTRDCLRLQSLIDLFAEWCSFNHMTISIQKCTVISFTRKKQPIVFDYSINGSSLQRSDNVTDLGVVLDSPMSFRQHYTFIINKAYRQLGTIFRIGREFCDPGTLRTLYCSLVRSILETSCVVWNPHYEYWILRIERIQKCFIRRICRMLPWRNYDNLPPYEDLCQLVGIAPLEQRRKDITVKTVHKILSGCFDCPAVLSRLQLYCPLRPRRNQHLLRVDAHRTNYGLQEPIRQMALEYNRRGNLLSF